MKRLFLVTILAFSALAAVHPENAENISDRVTPQQVNIGISAAFGGRYDPVRMCVGSPAGVPGGPAGEFLALLFEYRLGKTLGIGFYLPVARPILFAAAFQMLQFLPELSVIFHIPLPASRRVELVTILGAGATLHYGPDYMSDMENRGEDFFASGPRISVLFGPLFHLTDHLHLIVGVKPYGEYLYSLDGTNGLVLGGELDVQLRYSITLPE